MKGVNHKERSHALLSASSAKRWLACPPSARIEDELPEKDTTFSLKGTLAHEIAERKLREYFFDEEATIEDHGEIEEQLHDYLNRVKEVYHDLKEKNGAVNVYLERRLDFSDYVPEGFGTGDVVMLSGETLYVIDLKFGKGVTVDAEDNPQLKLYGLGAINAFEDIYDFEEVVLRIDQPRLDHVSEVTMTKLELLEWGEDIRPKAKIAYEGKGEFKSGEHCKFCKAQAQCRVLAEENLKAFKEATSPELLASHEIAEVLEQLPLIENWVKAIKEFTLAEALKGEYYPGFKLVEGRSIRKYADEIKVAEALKEAGYAEALIYEKKLYGITAMEKNIGKSQFNNILGGLITKPPGAPTLVPESDKRPVYNTEQQILDSLKEEN